MIKKIKIDLFSLRNKLISSNENKFYQTIKRNMMDFDPAKDYYKILGVDQNASEKQIKVAYFQLAKRYHPDVNKGKTTDEFKEMTNAYDILSDANKKKQYDEYRGMFKNQSTQHQNPYYSSQQSQNPYNYDKNTDSSDKTGRYKTRTTYSYRDPKTGEFKSKTYEGNYQGNPFFKDFEDFFKNARTNPNQDNPRNDFKGAKGDNNKFYNFNDFHDPYSQRGNPDRNRQGNEKFKWNPQSHNWDYDYLNYLYAKRIFKLFFIATAFLFVISYFKQRSRQKYYDEMLRQQPYVTFSPYPPNPNAPPTGPNSMSSQYNYTASYPPNGVIQPAYNQKEARYINDPYVNPYMEPRLR
jgi:curved DNA-binding protein CbpA